MSDILVIDDFCSKDYFKKLQDVYLSLQLDWYYSDNITGPGGHGLHNYGFTHSIIGEYAFSKDEIELLTPFYTQVMDKVPGLDTVIRCRADMTTYHKDVWMYDNHVDFNVPHTVAILYLNDSDGDTVLYNERDGSDMNNLSIRQTVSPKANRVLIFDGTLIHTGHAPSFHNRRVILNTNFVNDVDNRYNGYSNKLELSPNIFNYN